MVRVWYAEDGSLYASTASGKTYRTENFEAWDPVKDTPQAPPIFQRQPVRAPQDNSAVFVALSESSQEIWGLGRQLFRSTDEGRGWETLTANRSESVVGAGIRSVAVSPRDSDQIVVASDNGVWRSMDGGLTWSGLNLLLPNLLVERILATPSGVRGIRIQTENLGVLELPPGAAVWEPMPMAGSDLTDDMQKKRDYSARIHATPLAVAAGDVTVFKGFGTTMYAGTSNGLIFRSVDGGLTFPQRFLPANAGQVVQQIFVDPTAPQLVLVALSGDGPRVMRSVSAGNTWDDLSSDLPKGAAHALAVDRASGAVYVATDTGVFYAHAGLDDASPAETWSKISEPALPKEAKAVDVRLDPSGVQLYAALEGYGVYAAPAPHRARIVRLVNAADYTDRPAAPGSLVSVMGQQVSEVRNGAARYPVWNTPGTESQIQVPFSALGPTVVLALTTASGQTLNSDLKVQPVSPAIFVGRDGIPALFDADTGMALETRNVAHAGQRIQILATGLGRVEPLWPTGRAAESTNTPRVVAQVKALLDRSALQVTRATLAPGYVGTYLVEVQLPVIANYGAMELYVTADGQESNHVQIVIVP